MTQSLTQRHHIYIAARYSLKETVAILAEKLIADGHNLLSDWHHEKHAPGVTLAEIPDNELRHLAYKDMLQIRGATAMVFLAEDPEYATVRGGRHVEFGIALERGIPILVLGTTPENIFHYLSARVQHFSDFNDLREALKSLPSDRRLMSA
jgi:hypothetical protein